MAAHLHTHCPLLAPPRAGAWAARGALRRPGAPAAGKRTRVPAAGAGRACCRGRRGWPAPCRAAATSEAASGDLPAALEKIVTTFSAVPDAKLKYQQLLYLGKKLDPMPASLQTEDNKVKGCVSQVWVHPEMRDGKVYWLADSDSMLTKGLAALLVQGLSGCPPSAIVGIKPDFIAKMGLSQALTPSRSNGFLNMLNMMQAKALQLTREQS